MNTVAITKEYQPLPLSLVQESPDNPRQTFDKTALHELAESIKVEGLQVPIIVRPINDGKAYELIAGARRLRASMLAGKEEIPAVVRNLSDEEARAARLIENLLREDLQPLEEAEAFQHMLTASEAASHPLTPADLAAKIGKAESHVRLRLKLLSAEQNVKEALRKQQITLGHALELARLDKSLQKDLLKFCLFDEREHRREFPASLAQLRQYIARRVMLDLTRAPFKTDDASLLPDVGACTDCKNRTGNAQLLFADIKQGDICTLPSCFDAKTNRYIDVTVEQLKASTTPAVKVSFLYYTRTADVPQDALMTAQYTTTPKNKSCADTKVGIYVDGAEKGKRVYVCTNPQCTIHNSVTAASSSRPEEKERRRKAKKEASGRAAVFAAIYKAASEVDLEDDDYITLAEYALYRADHNGLMRLAKLIGWPKELFGWDSRKQLRKKLDEIGAESATVIALMASVSNELSVSEFNSGKPERLEALAKAFRVDTAAVRKGVEAELAAKAKKRSVTKQIVKK